MLEHPLILSSNSRDDHLLGSEISFDWVQSDQRLKEFAQTSSNAHSSAKLEFTMLFMMVLHMLSPQFSPPPDVSPQTLHLTRNSTFPFDLSFDPYPFLPPLTSQGCTSNTVNADITSSPLPPKFHANPTSQIFYKLSRPVLLDIPVPGILPLSTGSNM